MGDSAETHRTKLTNESNEKIASQNIEYQKQFNQQVFSREDNANQRAVADMRAAGLSPLANYAASGSGGVAASPQSNMHYETGQSNLQETLAAIESASHIGESMQNQMLGIQQMQQNGEMIKNQRLVNQSQAMQNWYDRSTMIDRVQASKFDNFNKQIDFSRARYDYEYRRYYGIHEGDTPEDIRAKIIARNFVESAYSPEVFSTGGAYAGFDNKYWQGAHSFDLSGSDLTPESQKDLYNFSAAYGEISDQVLDRVNELVSSYLRGGKKRKGSSGYYGERYEW